MDLQVQMPHPISNLPSCLLVPLFQRPYLWNEENIGGAELISDSVQQTSRVDQIALGYSAEDQVGEYDD